MGEKSGNLAKSAEKSGTDGVPVAGWNRFPAPTKAGTLSTPI
jgi:hypothetical protein